MLWERKQCREHKQCRLCLFTVDVIQVIAMTSQFLEDVMTAHVLAELYKLYKAGKSISDLGTLAVKTQGMWGGGHFDIFIHVYVGSGHFFGFKILNFNIFWGFQENEYFWGTKILWIFLGGHHKIGLYLGVISIHFRVFS